MGRSKLKKVFGCVGVAGLLLAVGLYAAYELTPWPRVMFIRYVFTQGGQATAKALEKHVPANIEALLDERYDPADPDGSLDVFFPQGTKGRLPTIVWIHGGAFVSGDKSEIANYLKILAGHGFTVVGLNYALSPERHYPTPIVELNGALAYLVRNAERYHIDDTRILLAGDSAGSNLAAQAALLATNPEYASLLSLQPGLQPAQIKGLILNCGPYDIELPDYSGPAGKFLNPVLWAYSGRKDFLQDKFFHTMSVANYITKDFPPALVTAGNDDFLEEHSKLLVQKLEAAGVPHETIFYAESYQPKLPHEYQFNLDFQAAQDTLSKTVEFAQKHTHAD